MNTIVVLLSATSYKFSHILDNPVVMLDKVTASLAYIALILVVIKFVSKLLAKKNIPFFAKLDRFLMKIHKPASLALIVFGTLHAIFSVYSIASITIWPWLLGLICLLSCIAAVVCFVVRKKMPDPKRWLTYHRIATIVALITYFAHVILAKIM